MVHMAIRKVGLSRILFEKILCDGQLIKHYTKTYHLRELSYNYIKLVTLLIIMRLPLVNMSCSFANVTLFQNDCLLQIRTVKCCLIRNPYTVEPRLFTSGQFASHLSLRGVAKSRMSCAVVLSHFYFWGTASPIRRSSSVVTRSLWKKQQPLK